MSLLRLLRAGKSLIGSRESGNQYRLLNGPALPKFGSDKNPFREPSRTRAEIKSPEAAAEASALPDTAVTPDLPKIAEHQLSPGETSTVKTAECKPAVASVRKEARVMTARPSAETDAKPAAPAAPSVSSGSAEKTVGVVAAGAKAAARVLRLNSKLNPLFGWARPKGGARALPRMDGLVQGELSLDRVKVMRNDLSDSDLEIVPAKKSSPASAPLPELPATVSPSPGAWERVTSRLFGAGKT